MQTDIRKALFGVVIAAASLVGGTSLALADDDAKAAEAAAAAVDLGPVANWNGAYIGLEGGYSAGADDWRAHNGFVTPLEYSGGLVGLNASYLRQSGNLVLGVAGNANYANISRHQICPDDEFICKSKVSGLESVRGVLGYAAGRYLVYGTAGLGFEQVSQHIIVAASPTYSADSNQNTQRGWVAGIGVDGAVSPRVSIGAQFLHYDFGYQTTSFYKSTNGQLDGTLDTRQATDVFSAHVTFKLTADARHTPLK